MSLTAISRSAAAIAVLLSTTGKAHGHEAWLLTPSEIEALARAPMPELFTSTIAMGLAAIVLALVTLGALFAEDRLALVEQRLMRPVWSVAGGIGPLAVRVGLALMIGLGALGGLPRAGTEPWTVPVLFVPDMQLALAPGWGWLGPVAFAVALPLLLGFATRLAAAAILVLAVLGLAAFGLAFLSYAPHFMAPALILIVLGPGWLSVDGLAGMALLPSLPSRQRQRLWFVAMALVGGTFVYLGIVFKLMQPTLLIAILEHGGFPTFGLPTEVIALVMTGVEVMAGLMLALGRLVRPVALFLIGAFTLFAVTLGETPLFHANLYGCAVMLLLAGARVPRILPRPAIAPAIAS